MEIYIRIKSERVILELENVQSNPILPKFKIVEVKGYKFKILDNWF